jgi:membrane-bound metal-dependent hydrolase YbcI (DUF457 family)
MLAGHLAVGFVGKRIEPKLSLGTLILASLLPDVLWCIFMLAGIEHIQLKPGRGAANYFASADIAYSHSLLTGAIWGALFAAVYFARRRYVRGACILFAAVLSHWVLDVVAHRPDMPLSPGVGIVLGLRLWTSIPATLIVEGGFWLFAVILYARFTDPKSPAGVYAYWSVIALLTFASYNNIVGAPPPSPQAMGISSLIFFSLIVAWAYWMNRVRPVAQPSGCDGSKA